MVPPVGGNNFGIIPLNSMVGLTSMYGQSRVYFSFYKERLLFGASLNGSVWYMSVALNCIRYKHFSNWWSPCERLCLLFMLSPSYGMKICLILVYFIQIVLPLLLYEYKDQS